MVEQITSYLFHAGGDESPAPLQVNESKSFIGNFVLGMGFSFDDGGTNEAASPMAEMERLVALHPRNAERIFPYINGGETNERPAHAHSRYIINFDDWPQRKEDCGFQWMEADEAQRSDCLRKGIVPLDYPSSVTADYPDLLQLVQQRVLPERLNQDDEGGREKWWLHLRSRLPLYATTKNLERILVRSLTSTNFSTFTFLPNGMVYDQTLLVCAFHTNAVLGLLCSRCHEEWALFFAARMKDDPRYNVDESFKPFPFPAGFETNAALEAAGREYYEFRAALMVRNHEGLTKTYNRFHDPEEASPDLHQLRTLHAQMDAAVLTAYGWTDLLPQCRCEFLLDYEDEETESGAETSTGRKKKKPWRYRWPTKSAMKSLPACSSSTPSEPRRSVFKDLERRELGVTLSRRSPGSTRSPSRATMNPR